ncbi:hypothetical protein GCM10027586_00780 [Kineococcus gypseus]|uniref:phage tail tube protein n=1 Tax=Kineococcus gypseus TaxID=1637102 RepID=UPI003D7DD9F5
MSTLLARRFRVDIDTSTTSTPDWEQFKGITALTFNPSEPTVQDASTYDNDGWGTSEKTMQRWSLAITANIVKDDDDDLRDPAQEAVRAAAIAFGGAARVRVRIYDRNGEPEAYQGVALAQYAPAGGGTDALDSATFTLSGDGRLVPITNPADSAPVTTP